MLRTLCLAGLLVAACATSAPGQVTLAWKWREGDCFWVQHQLDKKVRSKALAAKPDAKPLDFTNEIKRNLVCKVQVLQAKPDGSAQLELTFEQVEWKSNGPIQDDPLLPLEGQSVQVTLDKKGKLVTMQGVDILVQRATGGRTPEARAALQALVRDNVKGWVESLILPLPATPVQQGSQWQETTAGEDTVQGKWSFQSTYTYQTTRTHQAKTLHAIALKVNSTLTPPAEPKSTNGVRWEKTTITKNDEVGHIWFDNERGRPVQFTDTTHLSYDGDLTENGVKVKGSNDLLSQLTVNYLDRSPFADNLLPRQPFDPAERLKVEPTTFPRQVTTGLGQKLNLIPRGSFVMGSPRIEPGRYGNEQERTVEITRPFYLGVHEVTVAQFRQFVAESGYRTEAEQHYFGGHGYDAATKEMISDARFNWKNTGFPQADDHPVVNVSWNDAVKFCEWLSARDKRKYRLPTEAEWEYACRAGTTTRFACGDDVRVLSSYANGSDEASMKATFPTFETIPGNDGATFTGPVGKLKPNGWGLHDMTGNVLEWCSDWLAPVDMKDIRDPKGPQSGTVKVMRGGSWPDFASDLRVSRRSGFPANCRYSTTGFRLVLEP